MNQDSAFFIGKTHNVCQDYAVHGANFNDGFAIVSDGCSSSPNTDFGSRFLAMGARNAFMADFTGHDLDLHSFDELLVAKAMDNAISYGDPMHFHYSYLDATMLLAHVRDGKVNVIATGDGVIVTKDKDGVIIVREITYADGAPVYMNYYRDEPRITELRRVYDCTKTIKTSIVYKDGEDDDVNTVSDKLFESFQFDINQYEFVAVMTDGVSSFQKPLITPTSKTWSSIKTAHVVRDLMAIKGVNGPFVERRCKAFLRDCQKQGIIHADDFSVGMIYTGNEQ